MSIYYNASGETREIDDALYAAWVAAGNPKAQAWTLQPQAPAYDPQTHSVAWDGAQWVVSALPPPAVPESVPAHHLRRALTQFAMRAAVEMHIAMLDEGDPMRDDWQYAPSFRRDAVGIESARVSLGLTNEQVDALFIAAGNVVT